MNCKKSGLFLLISLIIVLMTAGCSGQRKAESAGEQTESAQTQAQRDLFAMDTVMTIQTYGDRAEEAAAAAQEEIYRLDAMLSTGKADSEVSLVNEQGQASVSEDCLVLAERSVELWQETDGVFNITIYPLMKAWGFTDGNYRVPDDQEISGLLKLVDMDSFHLDHDSSQITLDKDGMAIDLGGIAKGYTSARLMDIFREYGLSSALVSLGGNVQVLGRRQDGNLWRVGIEDPKGEGYLGVLETADRAVITSGGYERYFEQDGNHYHHILDPQTGKPADSGLASVTIVSEDGTLADALSTSLFIMGRDKAAAFWRDHAQEFDMILQEDDGTVWVSEGIQESFLPEGEMQVISR